MLKITLATAAVLAAITAPTAMAAKVYQDDATEISIGGRIEARAQHNDDWKDTSRMRLNVKGQHQLGDGAYAYGFSEHEFRTDKKGDGFGLRYMYAGLGNDLGSVHYGHTDGAVKSINDFTDIGAYAGANVSGDVNLGSKRQAGMIVGQTDLGPINLSSNVQLIKAGDDNLYGLAATYASDFGLALGLGYEGLGDDSIVTAAGSYKLGNFYLAGLYTDNTDLDDESGYELAANYKINRLSFNLVHNGGDVLADDTFALEATYRLGKARSIVSYENAGDDNVVVVGLRFDF